MSSKANKLTLLRNGLFRPLAAYNFLIENKRLRLNRKYPFGNDKDIKSFEEYTEFLSFTFGSESLKHINEHGSSEPSVLYQKSIRKMKSLYGEDKQTSVLSLEESMSLYFSVLIMKPEIVVETGVSDGISSLFILSALEKNGRGNLYSIDFPEVGMPKLYGKEPGWIVDETLRTKWTLIYGKSSKELLPLLTKLRFVNIFLHDSEHSYPNMKFEFSTALKYMQKGSLLLSDDVRANGAFLEVCSEFGIDKNNICLLTGKDSDLGAAAINRNFKETIRS